MYKLRNITLALLIISNPLLSNAESTDAAPQQKTGSQKVAEKAAVRAWEALKAGRVEDARYQFNQAFMFDKTNALALWGMAVIHGSKGEYAESIKNFEKAEPTLNADINFGIDYARTLGHAGVAAKNEEMVVSALERFKNIHERAPQQMMNLQNWAIILFYVGEYAEAWNKIALAEQTPEGKYIDQKFVSALQSKMPRPAK